MKRLKAIISIILVIAILLIVSTMDYQDEVMEQKHYCEMVREGYWPDYKENYNEVCKPESTEKTASKKGQE